MAIITIVGAGLMGTAVAWPLADNGHDVRLVGTHLDAGIIRSCVGLEVCAALKNAYTVAVGIAEGLLARAGGPDEAGAGMHNLAGALFGASAAEMTRIVALMGGGVENVAGLPGVGDQYVTCVGGRTIRLGRLLGMGQTYTQAVAEMAGETLEGAYVIADFGFRRDGCESAIRSLMLCRVITQDAPVAIPFDALLGEARA